MLKSLFSSSIRADVLAMLLNSPDEKFYVREIAKLLKKNPSGVKRELDKLEEMELVVSERIANLKYFHANKSSPLFSELKDLIAKSLGLPGALKSLLKANEIKSAFIYGPYTLGEDTPTVDLFAVGSFTPSILAGLHEIEKKFGKKINCTVLDESEYRLKKKKDSGVKRILSEKRITLFGRF
jgi:predicted transcriptional regulator with HTH domain